MIGGQLIFRALNPRNVGIIEDPDGMGEVGSMACGDALKLFLNLRMSSDENYLC